MILDMRNMDRIRDFDEEFGVIDIEPGVTQDQVATFLRLRESAYMLDVTGSGKHTSIVGNALERGAAYNGLRAESIVSMEVLTPQGDIIRTGGARLEGTKVDGLYQHGIGPGLTGLFLQSNLGVVLSMRISLKKRQPVNWFYSLQATDEELPHLVVALQELMSDGIIQGIPHIADFERTRMSITPNLQAHLRDSEEEVNTFLRTFVQRKEWMVFGSISGPGPMVRARMWAVRRRLRSIDRVRAFSHRQAEFAEKLCGVLGLKKPQAFLQATSDFRHLCVGIPTDAAIKAFLTGSGDAGVDRNPMGFHYITPIAPMTGKDATAMVQIIRATCGDFGFTPQITLNAMSGRVLEAVVSFCFDKETESDRANACARRLSEALLEEGYPPYRLSIGNMDLMWDREGADERFLSALKHSVDPHGTLSPGRYVPPRTAFPAMPILVKQDDR